MTLCSTGHGEVCYESEHCPACEKIQPLEDRVKELMGKNDTLEDKLTEARDSLNDVTQERHDFERQLQAMKNEKRLQARQDGW